MCPNHLVFFESSTRFNATGFDGAGPARVEVSDIIDGLFQDPRELVILFFRAAKNSKKFRFSSTINSSRDLLEPRHEKFFVACWR